LKKLQELVQKENNKKCCVVPLKKVTKDSNTQSEAVPPHSNIAPEINKLINEISALKDANRLLEEKYQVSDIHL
jgi:hypothetical protein